jgi:hypothetical protein
MREKQGQAEITEDQVKLQPIKGIRPGVYLTVLYSAIIILILFLLLFLPGIRNPGSVLVVKTDPQGAAIRVDGAYMGTASDKIFVPKGQRTITAAAAGFESQDAVHKIPGRVFASLFFPRRYEVSFTLKTGDPAAAFALAAEDYAAWTFAPEPTSTWQIPLSLSDGAYRTGPFGDPAAQDILKASSRFAVTKAALRDLVRAKMLLDNGGGSPSPVTLAGSASDILVFLSENSGSARWLADLLPPESAKIIKESDWYKNEPAAKPNDLWHYAGHGYSFSLNLPTPYTIAALTFRLIPIANNLGDYMISDNPVPRTLYETFLNENPQWKDEQTGIFPAELYAGTEISEVSWFAAEAFCRWLTKRLPDSVSARAEIRLPTEAEWEYASTIISNMGDRRWEWCADNFAPLNFIKTTTEIGSPERTLRGKSQEMDRTSLPPDFSSPIVTFRPVIASKNE